MKTSTLFLTVVSGMFLIANTAHAWLADFSSQRSDNMPSLEARYTSGARGGFIVEAEDYTLRFSLKGERGHWVDVLAAKGEAEYDNVLSENGAYLKLISSDDKVYSSLNAPVPSRVNVYRRGPYYTEVHWLDVIFCDDKGAPAPIKGEVVFYCYPEKFHTGVVLHVTEDIEVKSAQMVFGFKGETFATRVKDNEDDMRLNDFLIIRREAEKPSVAIVYPVPKGVAEVGVEKKDQDILVSNYFSLSKDAKGVATLVKDTKYRLDCEIVPLNTGDVTPFLRAEIDPILSADFAAHLGRAYGYNPVRGCYVVTTDTPGGFNYHYYEDQNDYEQATLTIKNNSTARKIYVMHETGENPGFVECGVVLDEDGYTLPIMVETCKNFSCEKEEPFYNPGDPRFSETFFPVHLEPDETRTLSSLHLYQNWGVHPLKQISSLAAWMDYYHSSLGVTETTCYVPFNFSGPRGITIADFRALSVPEWASQPQHDNVGGHSFLRYADGQGEWHYLEYTGTTFKSTGPNWAYYTMHYLSDDNKIRVTCDVFELPQTDELRNFVNMRLDILEDLEIAGGDFARNFRLLNIDTAYQKMQYSHAGWGGATGEVKEQLLGFTDKYDVVGEPLATEDSFFAIYPDESGSNAVIITDFSGEFSGSSVSPSFSVFTYEKKNRTIAFLSCLSEEKKLSRGDYIEANIVLMPYGGEAWKPARKCARDFGTNAPRVSSVLRGEKLADFPARIRLDEGGKAEFTIEGGMDAMPLIIEGAKGYKPPKIYKTSGRQKMIRLSRERMKDGHQPFVCNDGSIGFVLLAITDGKAHTFFVEEER